MGLGKIWRENAVSGFTLIELIIVIGVIGVLAGGLLIVINPIAQIQKAHDAQRKSDLGQIQRALEQYYNDNNAYPLTTGSGGTPKWSIIDASSGTISFGSSWGNYIQKVPQDPIAGRTYAYKSTGSGKMYYLYAGLERSSDPQLCAGDGGVTYGGLNKPCSSNAPSGAAACGGYCNYGVSSTNTTP